jgi:hypothetical protein
LLETVSEIGNEGEAAAKALQRELEELTEGQKSEAAK